MVLFVSNTALATQLEPDKRNMDIKYDIISKPEKIGDLLSISWSFVLHQEENSVERRVDTIKDTAIIAKAYLSVSPELELISGNSVWWSEIEYDKVYSFTATYRVITAYRIIGSPVVEI